MLVGGGAESAEDVGFDGEGCGEGFVLAAVDRFEDAGDGEGGEGGDGFGEGAGAGEEVYVGGDFVDEAEAEGFGSVYDLSGEHEAEGGAAAEEAGEALGSTIAGEEA